MHSVIIDKAKESIHTSRYLNTVITEPYCYYTCTKAEIVEYTALPPPHSRGESKQSFDQIISFLDDGKFICHSSDERGKVGLEAK